MVDKLYVNMVKAGEAGGALEIILQRLADFKEKAQTLKRKVVGAMVYPAAICGIAAIVITVLMIWVIPVFEKMFKEMDSDGNGKVTIEEMEVFLDVPEDYPNRASYIRQHFELSDYNKDGFVTFEEFKTILANFQGIDEL